MGKQEGSEKKEKTKPAMEAPKAPAAPSSAPGASSSKGGASAKLGCLAQGCKEKDVTFNFCGEHFRQFKFGLITKLGLPVSDFERKFEHYQNWVRAQKVA